MSIAKIRRRRVADQADVDMTPMLDIVFIMLIFFIVTATFLDEQGLNLAEPPKSQATEGDPLPNITVYVDGKDQVSVNQQFAELNAVPLRVERLMAEKPDAVITLRADARASLDAVVYIKDQMDLAGRETIMKIDRQ